MEIILEQNTELVINKGLNKAIDYDAYVALMQELVKEKATTGEDQSESRIQFTMLNQRRMKRWDKTVKLPESLVNAIKSFNRKVTWLVLTESWCGDAAQTLPVINKFAEANEKIDFKVVLRDENEELMDQFLTNGSKSIPKLIVVDNDSKEVVGSWGPRSAKAAKMVIDYKEKHGKIDATLKTDLQNWYNKDKGMHIEKEMVELIDQLIA